MEEGGLSTPLTARTPLREVDGELFTWNKSNKHERLIVHSPAATRCTGPQLCVPDGAARRWVVIRSQTASASAPSGFHQNSPSGSYPPADTDVGRC